MGCIYVYIYNYIYQSTHPDFQGNNNRVRWAQRGSAEVIARDLAFLSKYFGKYTWPSDFGCFAHAFGEKPRGHNIKAPKKQLIFWNGI